MVLAPGFGYVCNWRGDCVAPETVVAGNPREGSLHTQRCFIFLDIDGVVHPASEPAVLNGIDGCFQPQCLERLKRIIDTTNALIVLSSTWREKPELLDEAMRRLAKWEIHVYDTTPVMERNYGKTLMRSNGRCREINSWLKMHSDEIGMFMVLDDMNMSRVFGNNCVVVDGRTGLSETDVQKVTSRLNIGKTRGSAWETVIGL